MIELCFNFLSVRIPDIPAADAPPTQSNAANPPTDLAAERPTQRPAYLSTYLPTQLPNYLPTCLPSDQFIFLHTRRRLPACLST